MNKYWKFSILHWYWSVLWFSFFLFLVVATFLMCYFSLTLRFYLYLTFLQQALIDEDRLLSRLEVMGNQLQACSKVGINLNYVKKNAVFNVASFLCHLENMRKHIHVHHSFRSFLIMGDFKHTCMQKELHSECLYKTLCLFSITVDICWKIWVICPL